MFINETLLKKKASKKKSKNAEERGKAHFYEQTEAELQKSLV